MARNIINRMNFALNRFEQLIRNILGDNFPPTNLCAITSNNHDYLPKNIQNSNKLISLKDIIGEGFVWAVPKCRRPIEVRMSRRFGYKEYFWKMLDPKKHITMCPTCGHHHEAGLLCHHCYTRVKNETEEMKQAIVNTLGLDPVEKDVVVLYEGENKKNLKDFWQKQRIIELPKPRPVWFHSNLLETTTQEPAKSSDVKPVELA